MAVEHDPFGFEVQVEVEVREFCQFSSTTGHNLVVVCLFVYVWRHRIRSVFRQCICLC